MVWDNPIWPINTTSWWAVLDRDWQFSLWRWFHVTFADLWHTVIPFFFYLSEQTIFWKILNPLFGLQAFFPEYRKRIRMLFFSVIFISMRTWKNTVVRYSKLYKSRLLSSNMFQLFSLVIAILSKSFSHFSLNFTSKSLIISYFSTVWILYLSDHLTQAHSDLASFFYLQQCL